MASTKLTNALLRRAAEAAKKHFELTAKITDAMRDRYGCTHSDVDCDEIIDVLDYGAGVILNVEDCDLAMARCGVRPSSNKDTTHE